MRQSFQWLNKLRPSKLEANQAVSIELDAVKLQMDRGRKETVATDYGRGLAGQQQTSKNIPNRVSGIGRPAASEAFTNSCAVWFLSTSRAKLCHTKQMPMKTSIKNLLDEAM